MKHCHIQINNELAELATIQVTLDQFFLQHQLCKDIAGEMMLVAEELLVNIINYGYKDDDQHTIEIILAFDQQTFSMTLTDDATPFDPLSKAPPPPGEDTIGGHGIPLVRALCDKQHYQYKEGCNIFSISKTII